MTRNQRLVRRTAGGALAASAAVLGIAGPAAAVGESVTVSPNSGLPDTANVNVSGTGFPANDGVEIYQCIDQGSSELCSSDPIGGAFTNANGAFGPTTVTVHAVFEAGGPTECRTGCRIVVQHPTLPAFGQAGISFARYSSK